MLNKIKYRIAVKQLPILFLAALLFATACKPKQEAPKVGETFTISGTISKFNFDTVYLGELNRVDSMPVIIDTATLKSDATISLTGISGNQNLFALYIKDETPQGGKGLLPILFFVNDSKNITFNLDWTNRKNYTIENSVASKNLKVYFDKIDSVVNWQQIANKTMDSLQKKKTKDTATLLALNARLENEYKNFSAGIKTEFDSLPFGNLANFYFMVAQSTNALSLKDKNEVMINLRKRFPDAMNTPAPNFIMNDPMDKKVSISQFKGKYVLLDFWASWCAPCRQENPNVVAAFNKYKNRNFTILGISLDEDKAAWSKAIQDDGLTWQHMSDLKGWQSPIVASYQFSGIPYNVLLDPDGNIIASNLRGPNLTETLETVLPK
jgi:peroxiredoxin